MFHSNRNELELTAEKGTYTGMFFDSLISLLMQRSVKRTKKKAKEDMLGLAHSHVSPSEVEAYHLT